LEIRRFEEAEIAYKKALKIRKELSDKNPKAFLLKVADTQSNIAILLMDMERLEEADYYLTEVLKIDPNYRSAWYNKACIESLRNNQEKSIKLLKKAIDLDKKYSDMTKTDVDLNNIKDLKEFKELIGE